MMGILSENWWAVALRGAAAIVFGGLAIIWPGITLEALLILFGAYALVDGVLNVTAAVRAADQHLRWWPLAAEGIAGIVLSIIAWVWPGLTALGLLYVIAVWAILTGILETTAAVRLRREMTGEWMLALSGIVSVLFGAVLILFPISGVLTVVWLIGATALLWGVILLSLAYRLRGIQHRHHLRHAGHHLAG